MHAQRGRSTLCSLVAIIFLAMTTWAPIASAGMIGTGEVAAAGEHREVRDEALALLARDDVRSQLETLGVDPAHAEARVMALTPEELEQLAEHMDEQPAGANSVVGALVFVFVVLLVTDILGFTNVFPFVTRTVH